MSSVGIMTRKIVVMFSSEEKGKWISECSRNSIEKRCASRSGSVQIHRKCVIGFRVIKLLDERLINA